MKKERLDNLLVTCGLAENPSQAQRLVMAGQVRVDGQVVLSPGKQLPTTAEVTIEKSPRFVSRGGDKLEGALQSFPIEVSGKVCADVGASTGGFTDCLLQHGAARVFAIDVGKGMLDWRLRQDARVTVMEGTNARQVDRLPEPVNLVTIDVSFISLKVILPIVRDWLAGEGVSDIVALVKPQFEADREQADRGKGVIHDPAIHRQVLVDILEFAQAEGFEVKGLIRSSLLGPKGNREFLVWLGYPAQKKSSQGHKHLNEWIQSATAE